MARTQEQPKRILVVCYGNICRSPAVEELLQLQLQTANLSTRYSVESAGVRALVGHEAARGMQAAAEFRGISLAGHRARQLTPEMAHDADVIIALDEIVEEEILILAGDGLEILLWPVDDPYGGPEEGYARALEAIEGHVQEFMDDLRSRARVAD